MKVHSEVQTAPHPQITPPPKEGTHKASFLVSEPGKKRKGEIEEGKSGGTNIRKREYIHLKRDQKQ
jgi:hypothetical protein